MTAYIAGHLATTGRMTDMDCAFEVEQRRQLCQIVRISVEIVAIPRLTSSAMAAPIRCNASITALRQEKHLVFERIRRQRPAMAEDNGLSGAPVLVIDFSAVPGLER